MSLLKSKQIQLSAQGDLIVGNSAGHGSNLAKGAANTVLMASSNTVSYSYVNALRDSVSGNAVMTTSIAGTGGENLSITSLDGKVTITADNAAHSNVDIILMPGAGGQVFIGNSGNSAIQGEANENLTILGGDANVVNGAGGDLVLGGGAGNGTGLAGLVVAPTGYTIPSSAPNEAFATIGYVAEKVNLLTRSEKQEDKIVITQLTPNFAFDISLVPYGDVAVFLNGLELDKTNYTVSGPTGQHITMNDSVNGYSLDTGDVIVTRYLINA
jgi:hypothetical protein